MFTRPSPTVRPRVASRGGSPPEFTCPSPTVRPCAGSRDGPPPVFISLSLQAAHTTPTPVFPLLPVHLSRVGGWQDLPSDPFLSCLSSTPGGKGHVYVKAGQRDQGHT